MLKQDRTIAAAYLAVMALKVLLHLSGESSSSPLEAVQLAAALLGTLGGVLLVASLHYHHFKLAGSVLLVLGAGHIAYALVFGWLYDGSLLGYARAGVSAGVGVILFAFARGVVADTQPTVPADGAASRHFPRSARRR